MHSTSKEVGCAMGVAEAIFCETKPPPEQSHLPINKFATWCTWSKSFRDFLREAASELQRLATPPLCHVESLDQYDHTYSWSSEHWTDDNLRERFVSFVRSLAATRPHREIVLLDGLMGVDVDSMRLHALFALLRGALVELVGDERAAMYAPLGEVGPRAGEFLLHADLYVPPILFNVFDQVACDESGASTFLSVTSLRKLLHASPSLPARKAKTILGLFEQETQVDRFDVLYDLLHGDHPWVPHLERAMEQRQMRIKLHAGQGYFLTDRAWLHGRDAPRGGVSNNRVRRLVFGWRPKYTNKPRLQERQRLKAMEASCNDQSCS
jgi:hypothetical protein